MTWTKLSDDFSDDCWSLSDQAFRLHVEGLLWSNRKLLDLTLSKADVTRFAKHPTAVTELLAVGWWTDAGDFYLIRHHASYQRLREDVLKQQEANRNNGRKGGRPPRVAREQALTSKTQSLTQSLPETQLLSESPSESKSERDRTGLAKNGTGTQAATVLAWPELRRCSVCHSPLDPVITDDCHPTCDVA